ncbi:MAG: hypothetical protein V3V20_00555 [Algisphaera sp.]
MAIDRPTFNESWYRVAELKPRLRSLVQVFRQHYRGRLWYVFRDPSNNQFFRVDQSGYRFVAMLDGTRTVAAVWDSCNEQLGDAAPTQGEAIQLLGQLYTNNLIHAELPADAAGMFDRYKKRMGREVRGYVSNIMFARIPLFDPERLLNLLAPALGWIFGPVGLGLWFALIAFGLYALTGRTEELFDQSKNVLSPSNLPLLYVSFGLLKVIHEMGHGLSVKYFGKKERVTSEVHTMGLMLMVLTPVPYVDASSAWAFRSRWRRAFVGAAGMYVELATAAVAAIVWSRTGTQHPLHGLAYNAMFVASVSTLLFNANPLIKFDGYYILSDLAELPNLYQRSKDYLYYLIKKHVYGVINPRNPAHSFGEVVWFVVFGLISSAYRVFLGVTIVLFVAGQLFFVGMVMAAAAIATFLVVPWVKWGKFLAADAELYRCRTRALLTSVGAVVGVALLAGMVPVPDRDRAPALVEPMHLERVFAGANGFVQDVAVSGVTSHEDTVLVHSENRALHAEYSRLEGELKQAKVRYHAAMHKDIAMAQALRGRVNAQREQLARVERELKRLDITPQGEGTWVAADADRLVGHFVKRGQQLGVVATLDQLFVRAAADQYLGPRLGLPSDQFGQESDDKLGRKVELRNPNAPSFTYTGRVIRVARAGNNQLFSPALGYFAGGSVATEADGKDGQKASEAFFEVRIQPDPPPAGAPPLWAGQRLEVRFSFDKKPVAQQLWLALRQLLQKRLNI